MGRTLGCSDHQWGQSDQRLSGDVEVGSMACIRGGLMEVRMDTEGMLSQSDLGPPSLLLCVLSGHVYVSV